MAESSKGHKNPSNKKMPSTPVPITNSPAAGQTVLHEGTTFTTVQEGLAHILIPPDAPLSTDPKIQLAGGAPSQSVFYNPIQQYNRDLTVLAIRAFGEDYVADKGSVLEKIAERRRRNDEKKRQKRTATQGAEEAVLKRRRVENSVSETAPAIESTILKTAPLTLEELEDDDLKDEDFLACENSAKQVETALTNTDADKLGDEDDGPKTVLSEQKRPVDFKILDALSATGLRALRYAKELDFVTSVTANDLSPKAVESIKLNIQHNRLEAKVKTATGNANAHMYNFVGQESRGGPGPKYEVIDIDPYGTAVPFLDAAVQAVSDGGLLCITCTDSGVFNSTGYLEKTFSQYGGLPIKGEHLHEGGIRLILHAVTTSAAKYGIDVEPLLSLSIDYYARVFVRLRRSPADVKFLASKSAIVYSCDHGCGAWQLQFLARSTEEQGKKGTTYYKHKLAQGPPNPAICEHCGSKSHLSGPMYMGPLHNPSFIERMLNLLPSLDPKIYGTLDRIEGMLQTVYEEMSLLDQTKLLVGKEKSKHAKTVGYNRLNAAVADSHPFYVVPSALARIIHCQAPSNIQLKGALRRLGYRAVRSHAKPGTIKTDAPWTAIWDIMREFVRQIAPIHEGSLKEGTPGFNIMRKHDRTLRPSTTTSEEQQLINDKSVTKDNSMANGEKNGASTESGEGAKMQLFFDEELEELGRDKDSKRLVRYQMNPRANWGPMTRAK